MLGLLQSSNAFSIYLLSTTFPVSQLINLFLKSRGRTVNGTNYWNLYANYFKEHIQTELARIGREAPAGGGTPSATVRTQCYDKFKEAYPDSYQDLLSMHEEAALLGSSTQTIAQRRTGIPETLSKGFEAAISPLWQSGQLKTGHLAIHIARQFWQTRCHASDDAIIGHIKAHVYNISSLAAVDEVFHDNAHSDPLTPHSTPNDGHDQSQAPEGWDDGLKWVKLELIKQVAQLGGKCAWDKNFPWKGMSSALADANLCIRGYPAHKCLLPGEAHNENSKNKGIGALTQKEIAVLVEALKSGTMQVVKVDKAHRASVMASERPVITGIAPPSDCPHAGARRLFINGDTDYHGPARLKPSNAATKVKKADKVTKASPPPDDSDSNTDSDDYHPAVPAVRKFRKPTMRVEVVALPSRPANSAPKPEPTAALSEVIELSSATENAAAEPDTDYEEARGKKRKLKSTNTSRASKKLAPSNEKTDTSKVGKKAARPKQPKAPAVPTSTTSPMKGGPLSPLTVGSSSVVASPELESKGTMKCALRMVYSPSDASGVDEGKKMDVAVKSVVSPALDNVPVETLQEDLPSEVMQDGRPVRDQQEPPQITNPIAVRDSRDSRDPPDTPHQAHDELPVSHDPREGNQRDSSEGIQGDSNEGIRHPREPHREVVHNRRNDPHEDDPLRNPQEPRRDVLRDPRDTLHHALRDTLHDPRQPLRSYSREPWYMHDAVRRREVHEETPIIEHDALHPHDAFYHRDFHNPRYTSLQPHDHYGPSEPHANSDFTMWDSPPALEVHRDDHYARGERGHAYPSRYSPVLGPDYARESGYSRRDDLDERRAFGGGAYRDSGYPQGRTRYQDSRWTDRNNISANYKHNSGGKKNMRCSPTSPHLPISALLDFTNLPPFDHSLTVADLHRFFTSEHCVTNDVPADFLDHSLPPLSLSTQLLNTFSQAYHDGVKSVKDPRFLGNLPFWVVQYWHDLGPARKSNLSFESLTSIDTLRDLRDLPRTDPDMWQRIQLRSTTMRINDDSVDAEVSLPEDDVVESDGVDDEAPLEVVLEHIMSDKTYVPEGYIMGTDGSLIVDGAADKHCDMISPSDSEGSVRGVGDAVTNLRSNGYSILRATEANPPTRVLWWLKGGRTHDNTLEALGRQPEPTLQRGPWEALKSAAKGGYDMSHQTDPNLYNETGACVVLLLYRNMTCGIHMSAKFTGGIKISNISPLAGSHIRKKVGRHLHSMPLSLAQ
ncbi:hypothetical protein F4604DRAFT_1684050 [Suillus subluteus]|nr:hypothetical protein F4604DRAFT_1684050 [Suillus subluteus]